MVTGLVLAVIALFVLCMCGVVLLMAGSDLIARREKRARAGQAPTNDELPPIADADLRALLVEIYRAQTRARFKGIYGEDGS